MDEFWAMSPKEFYHAMKTYWDGIDAERRQALEIMRLQTVLLINNQLGRPSRYQFSKPEDLLTFTYEKPKVQTMEEMKEVMMRIASQQNAKVKNAK